MRGVSALPGPRTTAVRTSGASCSNSRISARSTSCAGTAPTASAASASAGRFVGEKLGSANFSSARSAGRV